MEHQSMMTAKSLKSYNGWRWGVALTLLALLFLLPMFTSIGPNSWKQCAQREGLLGTGGKATAVAGAVGAAGSAVGAADGAAGGKVALSTDGASGAVAAGQTTSAGQASVGADAGVSARPAGAAIAPSGVDVAASNQGVRAGFGSLELPPSKRVYFSTNSVVPRGYPRAKLAEIADYLLAHPQAKAMVQGYHDPRGNAAVNERLASGRAANVSAVLRRLGIEADRIVVQPNSEIVGSGNLAEARRVEVSVTP